MAAERPTSAGSGGSEMLSALIIYYDHGVVMGPRRHGHCLLRRGGKLLHRRFRSFPSPLAKPAFVRCVGRGISLSTHTSLSYL
jgi:hypothetical protein